jgi:acetyl-CoA acyltransferase 2
VIPVELVSRKATVQFSVDEHPRPQTDETSLKKLAPVFKKNGVVTAANASGICDGASANVVVSEAWLKKTQVKPLARIVSHHTVAVDPTIMGIGPVGAIKGALKSAGLSIGQVDLFDINEAFAAQWLAVTKELELPLDRTNMFGGAIGT